MFDWRNTIDAGVSGPGTGGGIPEPVAAYPVEGGDGEGEGSLLGGGAADGVVLDGAVKNPGEFEGHSDEEGAGGGFGVGGAAGAPGQGAAYSVGRTNPPAAQPSAPGGPAPSSSPRYTGAVGGRAAVPNPTQPANRF